MSHAPISVLVLVGRDPRRTERFLGDLRGQLGVKDECLLVGYELALSRIRAPRQVGRVVLAPGTCWEDAFVQARAQARNDLALQVCDDVFVGHQAVDRMVDVLDRRPELVAVGPRMPHATGPQSVELADGSTMDALRQWSRQVARTPAGAAPVGRLDPVCLLVRRGAGALTSSGVSEKDGLAVVRDAACAHGGLPTCPHSAGTEEPLLTLCMIVKNEEAGLAATLASAAPLVDSVIVYDTGSTDSTMEVARRAGATVVEGYWDDDFAAARNRAGSFARSRWLLVLDGDETLHVTDRAAVRELLAQTTCDALVLPVQNLDDLGGIALENRSVRVMRRKTTRYDSALHEQVVHRSTRRGQDLAYLATDELVVRHVGYRTQTMKDRDKETRNLAIAERALARARSDGGSDLAVALINAARSTRDDHEGLRQALRWLDEAWLVSRTVFVPPASLAVGAFTAAVLAIRDQDFACARQWRDRCEQLGWVDEATVLDANVAAATGDHRSAIAILDRVPAEYLTVQGRTAKKAMLLPAVLRWQLAAGTDTLPAVREIVAKDLASAHLDDLVLACAGDLDLLGRELTRLPAPSLMRSVCGQAISAPQGPMLLRVIHQLTGGEDLVPLAAAASVPAGSFDLDTAIYWSLELRRRGRDECCPLVKLRDAEDPCLAALACAVLADVCDDEDSWVLLPARLESVPTDQEALVSDQLALYAPRVAELLVTS